MIRKFSKIVCIYTDDKNYISAKFACPDLIIDDVLFNLTTNKEDNFNKTAEIIVDYAFALFCSKSNMESFISNPYKFKRSNWKLLDFVDSTKELTPPKEIITSAGPSQINNENKNNKQK